MAQSVNGLAAVCMTFVTCQIRPKRLLWLVSQTGFVLLKRLGPQRVAELVRWPGIKICILRQCHGVLKLWWRISMDIRDIRISKNSETKSMDWSWSVTWKHRKVEKKKNWWQRRHRILRPEELAGLLQGTWLSIGSISETRVVVLVVVLGQSLSVPLNSKPFDLPMAKAFVKIKLDRLGTACDPQFLEVCDHVNLSHLFCQQWGVETECFTTHIQRGPP